MEVFGCFSTLVQIKFINYGAIELDDHAIIIKCVSRGAPLPKFLYNDLGHCSDFSSMLLSKTGANTGKYSKNFEINVIVGVGVILNNFWVIVDDISCDNYSKRTALGPSGAYVNY